MHKKLMAVLFFLFIFLIPVISLITMPKEKVVFSETENRYLARFPTFSLEKVLETEYMKEFEDWANDRVVGRESWIKLKNRTERALGKIEINGVFITDERMMQTFSGYDKDRVGKNLNAMNNFAKRHESVPVYFMLAPTSLELYGDTLPKSSPIASQKDFMRYCHDELDQITGIDILTLLEEHRERYIYYRTDHHWTSLGAYIAYTAAGTAMGFTPLNMDRFNIETASSDFWGTLHSKTLDDSITPDIINIYTLSEGEPEVVLTVNDGVNITEHQSLYFREFLDTKDKYSTFLGINAPIIKITSDISGIPEGSSSSGKKLLIFKDSYAHSLIPFLAKNYSEITVVDMRYINMGYNAFFTVEDFDQVLFMYNVITFSEDTNLVKLNAGGIGRY